MKKAKSVITALLAVCMMASVALPAAAQKVTHTNRYGATSVFGCDEFSVKYNGNDVVFPDAQPFVDANGRTLVPVRFVSETMGAKVEWDGGTQSATITKGKNTVKVTLGKSELNVIKDGKASTVTMDTQAILKDDRTFVPVRFVAEELGAWVGYSGLYNTAQIYSDKLPAKDITRLHEYANLSWVEYWTAMGNPKMAAAFTDKDRLDNKPQLAYYTGENGFSNANEWMLRAPKVDVSCKANVPYKGVVSGATYTKGKQPNSDYAKMIVAEAIAGTKKQYEKDGLIEVKLLTDLSCIFASRHNPLEYVLVRGILLIHVPDDGDIAAIQSKFGLGAIERGGTYKCDVEVEVLSSNPSGKVQWVSTVVLN